MTQLPKLNIVKVVKFTGDRKSAQLADGKMVYRSENIWMGKEYGLVHCSPTGPHFVYADPDFNVKTGQWPMDSKGRPYKKFIGRYTPLCTCGSPAGVVGSNVYKGLASPTSKLDSTTAGQMVVCLAMVQLGHHLDGSHD